MIQVEQVSKSYGVQEAKHLVLNQVSLHIKPNDFTVILGPSGSGKSTLLHVISGLERADSGSVSYDRQNITAYTEEQLTRFRKEYVGFIFQQYYLLPHLNVEKNVRMGADLANNQEYKEMIAAVGLEHKLLKLPSELSGGEQQRVAIARALAKKPKVLFMDEPTGALDEATGRLVLDYIVKLQEQYHFSIVMVTHNVNIAEMADTVIKMNSGKIVETITQQRKAVHEIGW